MANAPRDDNFVPTILGVSSVDLTTPTKIAVNPTTGAMLIDATALDARFVNVTGDTMTGALTITPTTDALSIFQVNDKDSNVILSVDTTNNRVGIGTSSPAQLIHVAGAGNPRVLLQDSDAGAGNVGITFREGTNDEWSIASLAGDIVFYDEDAGEIKVVIEGGGNVGIGLNNPVTKLHVKATDTVNVARFATTGQTFTQVDFMADSASMNFYILDSTYSTSGAFAADSILFYTDNTTGGLGFANALAAGFIRFYTGGSAVGNERLRIDNTGNVGIGTTVPGAPLDVRKASGNVQAIIGSNDTVSDTVYIRDSSINAGYDANTNAELNLNYVGYQNGTTQFRDLNIRDGKATSIMFVDGSAGKVGIGITGPTAVLHLKAGTATANTAPLKFNSGTLNTTAEAGAVEFLTDAFYGTITTGAARKTFAFLESPSFTTPNLGAATLGGDLTVGENGIILDPAISADGEYSGIVEAGTAGATLAFGDLVYLAAADSRWELADASAASTSGDVKIGICVLAAANDGDATTILLWGKVNAATAFPALTISAPAYISETAGDIVVAQPTTTDAVIRRVGFANTADELFFCPSNDYITHV